jgi:tetratricopeptide (TPR) repeat protein
LVLSLLLVLASVAVYLPGARNDFVLYDDPQYVTVNSHVTSGLTWTNAVWAFRSSYASNWHPLTWLSHQADVQVFGLRPGPQHLVNVGLHVLNAVLLFWVLQLVTRSLWAPAFVAALFGLHPLHVESVAWLSERKDVLSTCFFFLTLWAYGRYAERSLLPDGRLKKEPGRPVRRNVTLAASGPYLLALFFFALGLMSKPMLVTTPFVLLLLDYWPLGRFADTPGPLAAKPATRDSFDHSTGAMTPSRARRLLVLLAEKTPFFALSSVSCVVTYMAQTHGGAVKFAQPVGARAANALVAYVGYIGKMIWPSHLSVLYLHPGRWPLWQVIGCAAALVAISVLALIQACRRPYFVVGWLWFLGTLVPVIGLVQVGFQSMADRYTYVPMVGLFIALAWAVAELAQRWPRGRIALVLGAIGSLGACATVTLRQVTFWHDSETLFRRAVAVTKNNYLAYDNLALYYSGSGRMAEAMENYQKSLEINPADEEALNNLAQELVAENKVSDAIPYYQAALRANPSSAETHNNLGIALAMQAQLDQAFQHFQEAVRLKPDYVSAHANLGNVLVAQHRLAEAIAEYQKSLRLRPGDSQLHNRLANALSDQGRVEEAVVEYTKAVEIKPEDPFVRFNLGLALARLERRGEAITQVGEAVRLKPDYVEAKRLLRTLTAPRDGR